MAFGKSQYKFSFFSKRYESTRTICLWAIDEPSLCELHAVTDKTLSFITFKQIVSLLTDPFFSRPVIRMSGDAQENTRMHAAVGIHAPL